jgi:hypothetical protein
LPGRATGRRLAGTIAAINPFLASTRYGGVSLRKASRPFREFEPATIEIRVIPKVVSLNERQTCNYVKTFSLPSCDRAEIDLQREKKVVMADAKA